MEKGVLPQSKVYFHTPSLFAKKALYFPTHGGNYICSTSYEINRESYRDYLFMHIKQGKMEVHYKNNKFIASENSFVFLDCYRPHLYRALEETTFDWFHFTGNASNAYYELLYKNNGCVFTLDHNWTIPGYFKEILEMMHYTKLDEHAASILIQKILYDLERISNHTRDSVDETIRQAISYMEANYMEDITLADIAKDVQLSPYHFSRVFKKHTSLSPHQYLIRLRITYAKEMLYFTNLPINEIAFKCGFHSDPHFVTSFKKHTSQSPKKFRDSFR